MTTYGVLQPALSAGRILQQSAEQSLGIPPFPRVSQRMTSIGDISHGWSLSKLRMTRDEVLYAAHPAGRHGIHRRDCLWKMLHLCPSVTQWKRAAEDVAVKRIRQSQKLTQSLNGQPGVEIGGEGKGPQDGAPGHLEREGQEGWGLS